MSEKRTKLNIIIITIISIFLMFIIEFFIVPGYIVKSLIKISVFLIVPLIYIGIDKNINILDYFKVHSRRQFISAIVLGLSTYILIIGGYFILTTYGDLSEIRQLLYESRDINKKNFLYIALYISFINSLLEEFFFRGFLFLSLSKTTTRPIAYTVSALAFAGYHIGIMADWSNILIFLLALMALFGVALIFNYLNEISKNIYNSWLVHMFANLALNTVGLIIYGVF